MISNTIKGKSFSGCVKYVMNQSGAEMLDTNMSGRNALEMIGEFQLGRVINSNVKNIVFHASMSAAPGEELSNDTWKDLARDYLEGMGFDDNQYIVVRHHEPEDEGKHDHSHVHIVASRVKLTGECVSDSWDYLRSLNLTKELEQKYDLVPTPHHLSNQKEQHNPTKGEIRVLYQQQQEFEEGKRTEPPQPSARMKLQALIDELTQQPKTMTELIDKLQSTGVEVRIKQTRNNVIQGISFAHPDWEHGFKGSDLGKHYSWAGLQTHKCVSFDPVKDAEAIANSATNSRTSTNKKIAAKQLQSEVADGIAGTVTAESQTASSRISDTSATARSSKDNARGDRTIESADESADLQSDSGKQLVETAISSIARNFGERISRKLTEQSERELAFSPSGAGSKSRAAREKPAHQIDITEKLDQLGSTVHEFNAELSLQIGRNRSAGSDSRTASSTARNSQPTASPTSGISAADISQQFEEINRIHDGIRRRRREKFEQLNTEFTSRTIAQGAETESLPEEITLLKVEESKTAQNSYDKSGSRIKNKSIDSESNDDNKLQQQPQRQRQVKNPSQQSSGTRPSTKPVNPSRDRTIASLIPLVGAHDQPTQSDSSRSSASDSEDRGKCNSETLSDRIDGNIRTPGSDGGNEQSTQSNSTRHNQSSRSSSDKSRAVEYNHDPELKQLKTRQAATARKIRELAAESKRLEAERDRPPETEPQQPSSRNQRPTNKNQQQYTPSYKSPEPDLEL
ncbi:MAG: relaxase/mobilization nuclease domain-containing protein [Crinalium sp.]